MGELTPYGPDLGVADGVKNVTFASNIATMHPVNGVSLQQTLDLSNALAPLSLSWQQRNLFEERPSFGNVPSAFQVVVRDLNGTVRSTLYRKDINGTSGTAGSGNLGQFAGERVVLSFEFEIANGSPVEISNVSVTDFSGTQYVTNGTFDDGRAWVVPERKVAQNIQSGVRTVTGIEVRRMFYTQPNVLWGRFTDTFTNPSAAPATIKVRYISDLGSDASGIIYFTPNANGRAISSWDGSPVGNGPKDRDVGLVFGAGAEVTYESAPTLGGSSESDEIKTVFTLDIPAGATQTLVNFVVLNAVRTGETATDINARATEIDAAAADIANNFRSNVAYQRGMMQLHLDTLKNF